MKHSLGCSRVLLVPGRASGTGRCSAHAGLTAQTGPTPAQEPKPGPGRSGGPREVTEGLSVGLPGASAGPQGPYKNQSRKPRSLKVLIKRSRHGTARKGAFQHILSGKQKERCAITPNLSRWISKRVGGRPRSGPPPRKTTATPGVCSQAYAGATHVSGGCQP
jgi:hypothetical protein